MLYVCLVRALEGATMPPDDIELTTSGPCALTHFVSSFVCCQKTGRDTSFCIQHAHADKVLRSVLGKNVSAIGTKALNNAWTVPIVCHLGFSRNCPYL